MNPLQSGSGPLKNPAAKASAAIAPMRPEPAPRVESPASASVKKDLNRVNPVASSVMEQLAGKEPEPLDVPIPDLGQGPMKDHDPGMNKLG